MFIFLLITKTQSFSNHYKNGDQIVAYFGNIGVKGNPFDEEKLEVLSFYNNINVKSPVAIKKTIADYFLGNNLKDVGIHFSAWKNLSSTKFIEGKLDSGDVTSFKSAISEKRFYYIYVDDILTISKVGKVSNDIPKVYTNIMFKIGINNEVIVDISTKMGGLMDIESGQDLSLSYSVEFYKTNRTLKQRKEKYYNRPFFECKFHKATRYLSIMQGFLFSLLVVSIIKQMIADFDKQNMMKDFDDFDLQVSNDRGWKILHGDVFRSPCNPSFLSIVVGFGLQVAFVLLGIIIMFCFVGTPNDREGVLHTIIDGYALTSIVAGCVASAIGSSFGQKKWLRLSLGSVFFPLIFTSAFLFILSIFTKGPHSLSITAIVITLFIISIPLSPLATIGGWIARRHKILASNPSEIALVPRAIPTLPIYLRTWFLCIVTSIFIAATILPEFYFFQASLWRGNVYYTYIDMLISVSMALMVSACISVCWTFVRLQNECYSWHWLSYLAPSSISVLIFFYSVLFYIRYLGTFSLSSMISYFICSIGIAIIIGVSCGSVGFLASNLFVRTIFSNLKLD